MQSLIDYNRNTKEVLKRCNTEKDNLMFKPIVQKCLLSFAINNQVYIYITNLTNNRKEEFFFIPITLIWYRVPSSFLGPLQLSYVVFFFLVIMRWLIRRLFLTSKSHISQT